MTIIERAISYSDRLRSRLYARFLFWRKRRTLTPGLESIQLSKREGDSLEISVRVGCALYCDYCPQDSYVQNYSDKYQNKERVLSEETFFAAMANVPPTHSHQVDRLHGAPGQPLLSSFCATPERQRPWPGHQHNSGGKQRVGGMVLQSSGILWEHYTAPPR
jgi:hypothetical protein